MASCELLWFPKAHPGGYWFHLQSTLLSWESRRSLAQGSGPWQSEAGLESGGRWSQVVTRPSPCSLGPLGLSGPSCLHNKGPEEGPTVPPSTWEMLVTSIRPCALWGRGHWRGQGNFWLQPYTPGCSHVSPQGEPGHPGTDGATGQRVSSPPTPATPMRSRVLIPSKAPVPQIPQRSSGALRTCSLFF